MELKQRNLNATYQRNIRNKKKGSKKYRKLANRYKEDNGSLNTKLAALREELYQLKEDKQVVAEKAPELVIASSSVHSKETTMTPKNSTEKPVGLSFLEKNVQDLESQMEQLKRLHKNKLSIMNVHGSQKDIDRENAKYNKKFKDLLRKISQAKYELSQA